eukprot:1158672-Pelagomonas_calceolata.AAC.7
MAGVEASSIPHSIMAGVEVSSIPHSIMAGVGVAASWQELVMARASNLQNSIATTFGWRVWLWMQDPPAPVYAKSPGGKERGETPEACPAAAGRAAGCAAAGHAAAVVEVLAPAAAADDDDDLPAPAAAVAATAAQEWRMGIFIS